MDFNELMNLAAQNEKGSDKKKGYAFNLSAPKKEQKQKTKSEAVKKLLAEKEREKQREIEKRLESEKKKIFRIPKAGSSSTGEGKEKKENGDKKHSSAQSKPKVEEKPKLKLEEAVFKDLQEKNELYNRNDRARINFDGSFAVVRIAHKPKEGVPLPKRPVLDPVKETPKFNVALVKKSDNVDNDNSKMNSHLKTSQSKDISANVRQLKEKYGVDTEALKKPKTSTRRENKLKEIAKYKEKVKMKEKLKLKPKHEFKQAQSKQKIIKRANNAPPPMNFADILKMAETKQNEPVKVDLVRKPKKEEERPMTQEEREWAEKKKNWEDRKKSKEYQHRLGKEPPPPSPQPPKKPSSSNSETVRHSGHKDMNNSNKHNNSVSNKNLNSSFNKSDHRNSSYNNNNNNYNHRPSDRRPTNPTNSPSVNGNRPMKTTPQSSKVTSSRDQGGYEQNHHTNRDKLHSVPKKDSRTPQPMKRKLEHSESPRDSGPSQQKKKALPPPDEPSNPWDRIYGNIQRNNPKKQVKKRMIIESDEDEYDSELDDFIDDGDDGTEDYSSAIRDIFGYDKRKFRDEDDDIDNMESNFASCMKEEARSARLGLKEDLEDIRREQEEERLKALRRKKMKGR